MASTAALIMAWTIGVLSVAFSGFLAYEYVLQWSVTDPYSYSNTLAVTTDHYDLRLELDFGKHIITGEQKLKMRTLSCFVTEVILDIDDLNIVDILYNDDTPLNYKITRSKPEIGQALQIRIPLQVMPSSEFTLLLKYTTSENAKALSWLFPNQTEGETLPYLFSLCETTHCRSLAPFQDSPDVKSTFTTHVLSPKDIKVRMAGNMTFEFDYDNHRSTHFESNIPLPSYSQAIVAGDLAELQVGSRTYVIAEASKVSTYASSLAKLENWLTVVEAYMTPYKWGAYRVVVQPPSFPHDGVENPGISSISSSLLKGDTPSVEYAIHELAHAWAGNLVTPNSWVHVWIKESLATFIERKAAQKINGQTYYKVFSQYGNQTMYDEIEQLGEDNPLTSLYPKADSISQADMILNTVQAEKGFQMLVYIESLIGENLMDEFIKAFMNNFAYQSIDTDDFKTFLTNYIYSKFESTTAKEIYHAIDFDNWLVATGKPHITVNFDTVEYTSAVAMAEEYIINGGNKRPSNYKDFNSYSVPLKSIFLEHFLKNTTRLTKAIVTKVEYDLSLEDMTNPDHLTLFMQMAVVSDFYPSPFRYPSEFVSTHGRLEEIYPVYYEMSLKDIYAAQDIYIANTKGCEKGVAGECTYNPLAREAIEGLLYP